MATGCRKGCPLAKLGPEVTDSGPALWGAIQASTEDWLAILAHCIQAAQQAEEISPRLDPDATAEFLLNAWEEAGVSMTVRQDADPLR